MNKSTSSLSILDYTHLVIKNNRKEFTYYYLDDYDVYLNGMLVNKNLVRSNIPANPFGFYTDLYSMKQSNIELVIPIKKYYYLNTNINNKEVYDVGIVLRFNGQGYLNDEVISSSHKVEETGKYVLEIRGNNDERKIINFNVVNLSKEPTKLEEVINNEVSVLPEADYKPKKIEVNINKNLEEQIDKLAIIIIFSLSSVGIILGLVLPLNFKFWRKKDV